MLVAQAKEASELFTGAKISDSLIEEIYAVLSRQMENVILIGMPGSGKTSVGQALSQLTGRSFTTVTPSSAQNTASPPKTALKSVARQSSAPWRLSF